MNERERPSLTDSAEAFELLGGKAEAARLVIGLLREKGRQQGVTLPFPEDMDPVAALGTLRQGELGVLAGQCGIDVDADLFPHEKDIGRIATLTEALFAGLSSSSPSPSPAELHAEHIQFLQEKDFCLL